MRSRLRRITRAAWSRSARSRMPIARARSSATSRASRREQFVPGTNSLAVLRLVELHVEAAGHLEVRDETVAVVLHVHGELDAARLHLAHRGVDVVAVERDVRGARPGLRPLGGVDAEIGF